MFILIFLFLVRLKASEPCFNAYPILNNNWREECKALSGKYIKEEARSLATFIIKNVSNFEELLEIYTLYTSLESVMKLVIYAKLKDKDFSSIPKQCFTKVINIIHQIDQESLINHEILKREQLLTKENIR